MGIISVQRRAGLAVSKPKELEMELVIRHGSPVQGSLWSVKYRCAKLKGQQSRADELGTSALIQRMLQQVPEEPKWHTGVGFVITADPSGSDLFEVARVAIQQMLGEEFDEFTILEIAKVADSIRGHASVLGAVS